MRFKRKKPRNNGQHQSKYRDAREILASHSNLNTNLTRFNQEESNQTLPVHIGLSPEWQELNDDNLVVNIPLSTNHKPPELLTTNKPDFWNYTAVGLLVTLYVASFISTYISSSLLFYLLSGGVGMSLPMFGTQIATTEAVALMGVGILEGASLSDAYLEHKKCLQGSRKWLSHSGRFLAFIAQGLLYYMALGQLLFATADVTSLGGEKLDHYQHSADSATLILEPPSLLHGVFVGTISFAWSFGNSYMSSTALLVAIDCLRRRRS